MLRAALADSGWWSGTTPRPMAVARKGAPTASTNRRSWTSAWEKAAPLPTTSSGLRRDYIRHHRKQTELQIQVQIHIQIEQHTWHKSEQQSCVQFKGQ